VQLERAVGGVLDLHPVDRFHRADEFVRLLLVGTQDDEVADDEVRVHIRDVDVEDLRAAVTQDGGDAPVHTGAVLDAEPEQQLVSGTRVRTVRVLLDIPLGAVGDHDDTPWTGCGDPDYTPRP
jgi:hypothetical protein